MLNLDPRRVHDGRIEQAFLDYCLQGPNRSLARLAQHYQAQTGPDRPPTRRHATLKSWSVAYNWQLRTVTWDAEERRKQRERAATEAEAEAAARHAARLDVAAEMRRIGLEALALINPKSLARYPQAVIRMLDSASEQERKDTNPQGAGPTSTTNVTVNTENKTIFVLPPNGRDQVQDHVAPVVIAH